MPAIDIRTWSRTAIPLRTEADARMHYRRILLNKLMSVFKWEGFDESIPTEYIETALLINGVCGFMEHENKVIPVICWGAEAPDEYYRCKSFTWSQPELGSGTIPAEQVIYNDNMAPWFGLNCKDTIDKYAELLAATDVSLKIAIKNSRLTHVFFTDNQQDVKNINDMVATVDNGGLATAIFSDTMVGDGAKLLEATTHGTDYMRQLAETYEYLYNRFLSEFGIHANTVLKRERELTGEIDMQIEKPTFNVWGMLKARQEGAKRISEIFGIDITVDFSDAVTIVEDEVMEGGFDDNIGGEDNGTDDGEAVIDTEGTESDTEYRESDSDNGVDESNEQQSESSASGDARSESERDGPSERNDEEGEITDESENDGMDNDESEAESEELSEGSEEAESEGDEGDAVNDESSAGDEVSEQGVTININISTEEGDVNADLETAQSDDEPDIEDDVQEDSDNGDDDAD